MLSLGQVLLDLDMATLRAIASQRGIDLQNNVHRDVVDLLTEKLLEPERVQEDVECLPPGEREALEALQRAGGQLRAHIFFHRFGPIRRYGPGKLERERPWENPVGPSEGLWYKGFIGRGFAQVEGETPEFIFIPNDLLPLLPAPRESDRGADEIRADPSQPIYAQSQEDAVIEDLFRLLVYVQLRHPRPVEGIHLSAADVQRLNETLTQAESIEGIEHDGLMPRLGFLHHLARQLGLVQTQGGRLRLVPEHARAWLAQPRALQRRSLLETWKDDHSWNDLWHVPCIRPEPAGWENDPLRARHRFLRQLSGIPAGQWRLLGSIIQHIKAADPDFQRPDGDYRSWYIRDPDSGDLLLGFEHWEQIEGRLIEYYMRGPLHWLGAVDLGYGEGGHAQAGMFCITKLGHRFLAQIPEEAEPEPAAAICMDDDLTITPLEGATLYYRFQLERFSEAVDEAAVYHVTPRSLLVARSQRIQPPAIVTFLQNASGSALPSHVEEELRRRWEAANAIRSHRLVQLEFSEASVLEWLREDPEARHLMDQIVSDRSVLLSEPHYARLVARMRELGLEPPNI